MIKVGQKTSWVHVSQGALNLALTVKQGIIIDIGDFIATIYKGRGEVEQIELFRLRAPQGPEQTEEILEAVVEGLR